MTLQSSDHKALEDKLEEPIPCSGLHGPSVCMVPLLSILLVRCLMSCNLTVSLSLGNHVHTHTRRRVYREPGSSSFRCTLLSIPHREGAVLHFYVSGLGWE